MHVVDRARIWRRLRSSRGLPPLSTGVENRLTQELEAAGRDGLRVLICTGNYRAALVAMDRIVGQASDEWRIVSPAPPGDTLAALMEEFEPDTFAFFQEIFTSGLPSLLAGIVNAVINSGRAALARQKRRAPLEGVTSIFDDYLSYLAAYAGLGRTVIRAELPMASADALLRTVDAYLDELPSLRGSPVLVVIGVDEAAAHALLTGPAGARRLARPYSDRLRVAELAVPPLRRDRVEPWLGRIGPAVADLLVVAAGGDDVKAREQWRDWIRLDFVRRRRRTWIVTPKIEREAARLYAGAIASVDPGAAPLAQLFLQAAALFGETFDDTVVAGAVAELSATEAAAVGAVWKALFGRTPPLFEGAPGEWRWSAGHIREHALRKLRQSGREAETLAHALFDAIVADPDTAQRHRSIALEILRLYPSPERLRALADQTTINLHHKVRWSMLLTLSRLQSPSPGLAAELADAGSDAGQHGYLLFAFELASRALDAIDKVPIAISTKATILLDCGRALSRSGHYEQAAMALDALLDLVSAARRDLSVPLVVELAEALHALGANLRVSGKPDLAVERLQAALDLRQAADPIGELGRRDVAVTRYELAAAQVDLHARDGQAVDIAVPRRTLELAYRAFMVAYGTTRDRTSLMDAGQCLMYEADTFEVEAPPEAARLYQQAVSHLLQVADADPEPNTWQRVANCYDGLGRVAMEMHDEKEALTMLGLARDYYRKAYAEDPSASRHKALVNAERAVEDARVLLNLG